MPDELNNREGPQAREPSKCLNGWRYGERLVAITPALEAVHVPMHLTPPGSPQAKQLCHLNTQLSLGQSDVRGKKVLWLFM